MKEYLRLTRIIIWANEELLLFSFIGLLLFFLNGATIYIIFAFIFYSIALLSYGYSINNYCDKKQDFLAGKKTYPFNWSDFKVRNVILVLLFLTICGAIMFNNTTALISGIINIILATIYSLKPRLKEMGFLGALTAALAQFTIPVAMLLAAMDIYSHIVIWIFFYGLVDIIVHQIDDYQNDRKTKIMTFAVQNKQLAVKMVYFLIAAELVVIVLLMINNPFWLLLTLFTIGQVKDIVLTKEETKETKKNRVMFVEDWRTVLMKIKKEKPNEIMFECPPNFRVLKKIKQDVIVKIGKKDEKCVKKIIKTGKRISFYLEMESMEDLKWVKKFKYQCLHIKFIAPYEKIKYMRDKIDSDAKYKDYFMSCKRFVSFAQGGKNKEKLDCNKCPIALECEVR